MYQKIIGPNEQNTNITDAIIWVLPKSGNIFTSIFFRIYDMLINGKTPTDNDLLYRPHGHQQFNKHCFIVGHAEFPGLQEMGIDDKTLEYWMNLSYNNSLPWVRNNKMRQDIISKISNLDPIFLLHSRVVFIFRNPLDQLLSHYKHFNSLPPDDRVDANTVISNISLEDFIFNKGALASYIKMFYTFHVAIQNLPGYILCIPYEELISNKPAVLRRIIKHLELPYDETLFNRAIELTSMENLKHIEDKLNVSLIGRRNNKTRHIRNGGIGVWQTKMTSEIIQRIEEELNKFDLSLTMFYLAEKLEPQFSFINDYDKRNSKPKFRPG